MSLKSKAGLFALALSGSKERRWGRAPRGDYLAGPPGTLEVGEDDSSHVSERKKDVTFFRGIGRFLWSICDVKIEI